MLEIELSSFLTSNHDSDMLDEYDFSQGIRGKYAQRYSEGSNIVKLDDDVAEIFPNERSVNDALRALAKITRNSTVRRSQSNYSQFSSQAIALRFYYLFGSQAIAFNKSQLPKCDRNCPQRRTTKNATALKLASVKLPVTGSI